MKEPGQMAAEAAGDVEYWHKLEKRRYWARIEAAIRAEEATKVRAAVVEECVKAVNNINGWETSESGTMYPARMPYGNGNYIDKDDAIAAIRELGAKP